MAALPVVLNVSHFYGEVLKLSLQIMGPIFIFARVVDAIQDPVIGLISDRFTRRGRRGRLAFVALMIPVLAAGFYMLFDPPDAWFGNQTMMAAWLIARAPAGPSRLFRRFDQLSRPRRGTHRRLQRAHQGHGRPRGVRPARHDPGRRAADLAHLQVRRLRRLYDARPPVPAHPRAVQPCRRSSGPGRRSIRRSSTPSATPSSPSSRRSRTACSAGCCWSSSSTARRWASP